ncbi:MAG: hypothetical protein R2838_14985 [Caldilineaceae bacterium]
MDAAAGRCGSPGRSNWPCPTPSRSGRAALAAELTAGLETPYAKARALERYLRQFEYDLTVAAPRS